MIFMLDTNICIEIIRQRRTEVIQRFKKHQADEIVISAITYSELQYGCAKSSDPENNAMALSKFLSPITVLDYPSSAAVPYGRIRCELEAKGQRIGPNDLLIASHCLDASCILVTNNEREFNRVSGLVVENWVKSE